MSERVHDLRTIRSAALDARGIAAARLADAKRALSEAEQRGVGTPDRATLRQAHDEALSELVAVRADEVRARKRIADDVARLPDPIERINGLDARFPIAFFPVRIETRYRRSAPTDSDLAGELLIRIYPDGILAQTHEPLLTAAEVAAGHDYWHTVFGGLSEGDAWTALVSVATATRGAWIVDRTTPVNIADRPEEGGAAVEPVFDAIEVRPDQWHRAPEAPTLPDRWIISLYRDGALRRRVFSGPVREGLALALRISGDGDDASVDDSIDLSGDGLEIEPELRWVYNFDEAVAAGMAVRVPLTAQDFDAGFSTVLVTGVRTTMDADAQAGELERLFDGHRYSRGLAFAPQGAKTNNAQDAPSDYPPADPAGAASFPVARGAPRAAPGTDGHRFAGALGLNTTVVDHVAGAERDEQARARAMADALWPATLGYFFRQMMAPEVGTTTINELRAWMLEHVRARGPYPAFRVGAVPYGLLPVSALRRWRPDASDRDDSIAARLPERLQRMARLWSRFSASPPHIGRSSDPDEDLVETLGQDASAQTVRIRTTLGEDTTWNILGISGIDFRHWRRTQRGIAQDILQAMGEPDWDPRILYMSFADIAPDFAGPLIQDGDLSETDPLVFDYIAWLRTAAIESLENQAAPPTDPPIDALLYLMLRHALLEEYDGAALDLLTWREMAMPIEAFEQELVGIVPIATEADADQAAPAATVRTGAVVTDGGLIVQRTAWQRLDTEIPGVTGGRPLGEFLADPHAIDVGTAPFARTVLNGLGNYRASLQALEALPTAELRRLFTETLDACSHRIDPWITGMCDERLGRMRETAPRGVWTGCYGWVENLRPDPDPQRVDVPDGDGGTIPARTDSGGYVYAPSMLHGATAAVLRSAYITRKGEDPETYAVDLSSRRVRAALALIDGVRAEQPLGAGLGYQFERGLHEGHPGVELDRFIDEFRALYPIVANKTDDSGEAAESVAARNVVDGLLLREAWRAGEIPWGSAGLTPDTLQRRAIEEELAALDDAVDAVSDLLLAESVHQVLRGSTAGAGATLDSLASGKRAPEPQVASTPRGGGVLHQRIGVILSSEVLTPEWTGIGATPMADAAPEFNAWLAGLVGPPAGIACFATPDDAAAVQVTPADLGLQPIDLLMLAAAADAGTPAAGLDRRIAWHAVGAGPDTTVHIDYGDAGGAPLSFAEMLEVLAEVARVLGYSRPVEPRDLVPPELESSLEEADVMTVEADARATAAGAALDAAVLALDAAVQGVQAAPTGTDPDLSGLRSALTAAAALGIAGAFPGTRHDNGPAVREALLSLATAVGNALGKRADAAVAAASLTERLKAVFGRSFPVLPRFVPAAQDLLSTALTAEPDIGASPGATVETWITGASRVREPLDAWRQLRMYTRALGREIARPRIVQLPFEATAGPPHWAALGRGATPHRSGLVSLALFGNVPAASAPWSGLLLDTWPEVLPNEEEDAGIVFHFDAPGAQAPQCVLLAVPPEPVEQWSWEAVEATLLHTLEMARVRALDLSDLGLYAQVIPLCYLAANPSNSAIATKFDSLLVDEALIVQMSG